MKRWANPTFAARQDAGLCPFCGERPPDTGLALCGPCRLALSERQKLARRLRRERAARALALEAALPPARFPTWIERGRARYGLPV